LKILTADEIRRVEEEENATGIRFFDLMERAGTACADRIRSICPDSSRGAVIVAGSGKNGGDGFVIARKLREAGYPCGVILAMGMPKAADAINNFGTVNRLGISILNYEDNPTQAQAMIRGADIVVDAVFGIGFHGPAQGALPEIFRAISDSEGTVFAIDVPSGVDTDTGAVLGEAVYADYTFAISCLKPAHAFYPARENCGISIVLDIGISEHAFSAASPTLVSLSQSDVTELLPERTRTSHKNDYGHVLSICGSMCMPGAACMCANAAIRSGAGLVTAAFPQRAYPAISSHLTEGMMVPLPDTPAGMVHVQSINLLRHYMERATTIVMGCGLGQSQDVRTVVLDVLQNAGRRPIVLDADGLNAVAGNTGVLDNLEGEVVVTPHPGEMSRLMNIPVQDILQDRIGAAHRFADEHRVTVLLKGPDTVIATYDNPVTIVNRTGNQGLAKGGSGDTLAGIIAALLAQGMPPFQAAATGAYLHGYAADFAAKTLSLRAMTATDLITALPFALKDFE